MEPVHFNPNPFYLTAAQQEVADALVSTRWREGSIGDIQSAMIMAGYLHTERWMYDSAIANDDDEVIKEFVRLTTPYDRSSLLHDAIDYSTLSRLALYGMTQEEVWRDELFWLALRSIRLGSARWLMANFTVHDYYTDDEGSRRSIMLRLMEMIEAFPDDVIVVANWQQFIIDMPCDPCIIMDGDESSPLDYVLQGEDDEFTIGFLGRIFTFHSDLIRMWVYVFDNRSVAVQEAFGRMSVVVDGRVTDAASVCSAVARKTAG